MPFRTIYMKPRQWLVPVLGRNLKPLHCRWSYIPLRRLLSRNTPSTLITSILSICLITAARQWPVRMQAERIFWCRGYINSPCHLHNMPLPRPLRFCCRYLWSVLLCGNSAQPIHLNKMIWRNRGKGMSKNSSIKRNRFIRLGLSYFLLLIVAVIIIYPLIWTVGASLNAGNSLLSTSIIPENVSFQHYKDLFNGEVNY